MNPNKRKKKEMLILDAMESLILEGKGDTCSVNEVARVANIAKGSVYYYFASKEDIIMALILRSYENLIENCKTVLETKANALKKLELLFEAYYKQVSGSAVSSFLLMRIPNNEINGPPMLTAYTCLPQSADMHLKTITHIITEITPVMNKIIEDGVNEGTFKCSFPDQTSQIVVTMFAFLFDVFIYKPSEQDYQAKLKASAEIMERILETEKGSFSFLYESPLSIVK